MLYLLVPVAILLVGVLLARRKPAAPPRRDDSDAELVALEDSASELAMRDPVEALLRFGTPADAERLARDGTDLGALGYRPDR